MISSQKRAAILSAVGRDDIKAAMTFAAGELSGTGSYQGFFLVAATLLERGQVELSAQTFSILRDAVPDNPDFAYAYGVALHRCGKLEEALPHWRAASDLAPGHVDSCRNLAMGLIDTGKDQEATTVLDRLLTLLPKDPDAHLHLGNIRYRQGDYAGAIGCYRRALDSHSRFVEAWVCLGQAELHAGDRAAAETSFRRAVSLDSTCRQAHFNLGCLLLEQGRWQEGFREYQWRANLNAIPAGLKTLPEWHGDAPAGARVAVWNDQGLGDGLQYLRYAPRLAARGYAVDLVLPRPLVDLVKTMDGIDGVYEWCESLPSFDFQAPLPSLPHLMNEPDPAMGWTGPYFPALEVHRRAGSPLSVGLVWAANPNSPNGVARSVPLSVLSPLADLPGIRWVSLQVGAATADIAASRWQNRLEDLGSSFSTFADTAKVVMGLDLVISVDTSVLHLAGALGKPLWVLLAWPADWRWMADGSTSLWYPTARLFRQEQGGQWGTVIDELTAALTRMASDRSQPK